MMKRVIALVLCVLTVLLCATACGKNEEDKGAYIRLYLSEPIYDFDPLEAFDNADNLQIVSMLFEGLFVADENGKAEPALVDEYTYEVDEEEGTYTLLLDLKTTHWNDGVQLTAAHAAYAFQRLFNSDASHPATALLYEIKNAREIARGNMNKDDLGVTASSSSATQLKIEFERDIDVDDFLLTLCSPALYPVRDDVVVYDADWAKDVTTMKFSGPFIIRSMDYDEKDGFVLERNPYYYRDREKEEDVDKYVTPFRLIADFTTPIEEQLANYNTKEVGSIYFLGNIPVSGRHADEFAALLKKGDLTPGNSTLVYYMNQNAKIGDTNLFANKAVRQALSLALDREAIAEELVFAKAADALVPETLLNRPDRKATFRDKVGSLIATSPKLDEAKQLLKDADIDPAKYEFSITVFAGDSDHVAAAKLTQAAWKALGFKVNLNELAPVEIINVDPTTLKKEPSGVYENPYKDALKSGNFEVIALDLVSTSVDVFGYLAPFATGFSGNAIEMDYHKNSDYNLTPHITGYSSLIYNAQIEIAYAEKNPSKRAKLLHEAEKILMEDMPVIPVVYNQNFSLAAGKLGKIETSFFCNANFTKTKLSGYWKIALAEGFVTEKEETEEESA